MTTRDRLNALLVRDGVAVPADGAQNEEEDMGLMYFEFFVRGQHDDSKTVLFRAPGAGISALETYETVQRVLRDVGYRVGYTMYSRLGSGTQYNEVYTFFSPAKAKDDDDDDDNDDDADDVQVAGHP